MSEPGSDARRQAVVDLLAALAYGELTAFERLATDSRLAPTVADKTELARMATKEFSHHERLVRRLQEMGVDPEEAMAPFVEPLNAFHDSTAPSDWLESLVKAYVGDGIAKDFYREVAEFLDDPTRDLVLSVLGDMGHSSFVVGHVRAATAANRSLAGRLALWARRLVGEALAQAQRVAVEREALTRLLVGGVTDLEEIGQLLQRLTDAHAERMKALGLSA